MTVLNTPSYVHDYAFVIISRDPDDFTICWYYGASNDRDLANRIAEENGGEVIPSEWID